MIKKISLKNLKRVFPKCNTESVLYLDENANILYKIIYMKYLSLQRIETINKLQEINNEYLILPFYGVTTSDYNELEGYAMHYYEDHTTLTEYIANKDMSFEKRKQLIYLVESIFENFKRLKYKYYDIHSDNILIDFNKTIKVSDADSGLFGEYDICDEVSINNFLANLYYQILLGIENINEIDSIKINRIISRATLKQQQFLYHSFDKDYTLNFNAIDYIEYFNEDIIQDARIILKK